MRQGLTWQDHKRPGPSFDLQWRFGGFRTCFMVHGPALFWSGVLRCRIAAHLDLMFICSRYGGSQH
jgi:hypothetical protein